MEQLLSKFTIPVRSTASENDINVSCREFESKDRSFHSRYYYLKENIIKCTSRGSINIETALESQRFFYEYIGFLKSRGQQGPYYLVMDIKGVKGADKEARNYLYHDVKSLFENKTLAFAVVIQPNSFVRTIGKIWLRLNKNFNYSFHKTEADAYQTLLAKQFRDQEEDIRLSNAYSELLDLKSQFNNDFIQLDGKKYPVISMPDWKFHSENSEFQYYLINGNIIVGLASGKINSLNWDFCLDTIRKIINVSGRESLQLIIEGTKMENIPLQIKKQMILYEQEFNQFITKKLYVLNSTQKTLLRILKVTHPKFVKGIVVAQSVADALRKAIETPALGIPPEALPVPAWRSKTENLQKKSKRELINLILENEELQQVRMNTLFEVFGRITWDTSFVPERLNISPADPFFDLFNGVNLLQDDVYFMIKELRDLNQKLENKVEERTFQLQRKNLDLQKVNEELDSLVYRVAHDLRSPLASMSGIIELLVNEKDPEKTNQLLELIRLSIRKMSGFINENIELSRHNDNNKIEEIDFEVLIRDILSETAFMKNAAGMQHEIKISNIPAFKTNLTKLKVILRNLLSNSIKYKSQDRTLKINFEAFSEKNMLMLKLSDNGIGIKQSEITRVFDKFYRVNQDGEGSGLGLHIVEEMVQKLNGKIEIHSVFGKGTTILLAFPLINHKFNP